MPMVKKRKSGKKSKKTSPKKVQGYAHGGMVYRQTTGYGAAKKDKAGMSRDA